MKASAGPLKAIPADSPYKPWALDAKNQRWRLQAMHPGENPSAASADAWISKAEDARKRINGKPPLPRKEPPVGLVHGPRGEVLERNAIKALYAVSMKSSPQSLSKPAMCGRSSSIFGKWF